MDILKPNRDENQNQNYCKHKENLNYSYSFLFISIFFSFLSFFILKAITLAKTCEATTEMRECRAPKDWSLLALQNTRTGKSHYLVICRCPDHFKLGKYLLKVGKRERERQIYSNQ